MTSRMNGSTSGEEACEAMPTFSVRFADASEDQDRLSVSVRLESEHLGKELERYELDCAELQQSLTDACRTFLDKKTAQDHNKGAVMVDAWARLDDFAGSLAADQLYAMGHIDSPVKLEIDTHCVTFDGRRYDGTIANATAFPHKHRVVNVPEVGSRFRGTEHIRHQPAFQVTISDSNVNDDLILVTVHILKSSLEPCREQQRWDEYVEAYLETYLQHMTARWSKAEIIGASRENSIPVYQELVEEVEDSIADLFDEHLEGYQRSEIIVDATNVSFRRSGLSPFLGYGEENVAYDTDPFDEMSGDEDTLYSSGDAGEQPGVFLMED